MFDIPIAKMNDKQLRDAVQLLSDKFAVFKRKCEDAINNLDSSNFGKSFTVEQNAMKAQIKITAQGLESTVSKTELSTELTKYSTIEQTAEAIKTEVTAEYVDTLIGDTYVTNAVLESRLVQSSNSILLSVSGIYQTKSDAEDDYELLEDAIASLELTVDGLTSTVSKNISAYFESDAHPNHASGLTNEQKSMLCLYDDTYYYYNDFEDQWEEYPVEGLTTMFRQTATGFELTGNVSVSGDLISGGVIKGAKISTADNFFGDGVRINSDNHSIEFLYSGTCIAQWGVGDTLTYLMPLSPEYNELHIYDVTALGTWDFSGCTVKGLTTVAVFG